MLTIDGLAFSADHRERVMAVFGVHAGVHPSLCNFFKCELPVDDVMIGILAMIKIFSNVVCNFL